MKTKIFVLQTLGMAASLAAAYLVLLVPDSAAGYLLLSLLLIYVLVFLVSFTLAAAAWGLATNDAADWREVLRQGWRRWGRAAGVLAVAAGVLYGAHRLGWLRLPVWLAVALLALLLVPAAVRGAGPAAGKIPRTLIFLLLGAGLAFASWKILSTPAVLSRPWMEIAWLGARVLAAFLVANVACLLLLGAGSALFSRA